MFTKRCSTPINLVSGRITATAEERLYYIILKFGSWPLWFQYADDLGLIWTQKRMLKHPFWGLKVRSWFWWSVQQIWNPAYEHWRNSQYKFEMLRKFNIQWANSNCTISWLNDVTLSVIFSFSFELPPFKSEGTDHSMTNYRPKW